MSYHPLTPHFGALWGGVHKMGGGQMIFPKNGGSVDAIDHIWGECSSKVIFWGGVEIKLVDFGGSVVSFHKKLGGDNRQSISSKKFQDRGR